jgi:hypothetical protein
MSGDRAAVFAALGRAGSPELVAAWKQTRGTLEALGRELKDLGKLKQPLEDYFPRIVTDHEGLLKALNPKASFDKAGQTIAVISIEREKRGEG